MNRTTGTSALALVAVSLGAVLLLPAFSAPKTGTTIDSPKSLAALFRSDQDRVLPGLPPAPERAIYGVRDKIVSFDPAAFPAAFLEALGPQDLGDGIVVYACKAFEDPKSREAVFLNASNKEIWREPAPEGYDPLRYLRSIDPKAVEADTKQAARLRAIYDPSRIVCSYVLASNDGADAYVRKLAATEPVVRGPWGATPRATFVPAARRPAGRTMNSSATIETPTLASLAFVPQGVDLTVSLPESFAGRVGLFARSTPGPAPWLFLGETNVVASQGDVVWHDCPPNAEDTRVYTAAELNSDSDNDGIPDEMELLFHGSNPQNGDSDGDGMPDGWEARYGLCLTVNDANGDADGDGVSNLTEYRQGRDPRAGAAFTNAACVALSVLTPWDGPRAQFPEGEEQ
jgi:hypothetical protein